MSTPILYPTVQPGVMDDGVEYTICILARQTSLVAINGGVAESGSPGTVLLSTIDSTGSTSATPGDMAVRFGVKAVGAVSATATTITAPVDAEDNSGNITTGTQTFVVRAWNIYGTPKTITAVSGTYAAGTYTLSSHGYAVGDRVEVTLTGLPSAGSPLVIQIIVLISAVTTNTFTGAYYGLGAYSGSLSAIGFSGGFTYSYAATAAQQGTNQNDITSAASVSGTRGTALSFTIATTSPGPITASGVPAGIGIQGALLSGTPLESGWLPVTLTAGTMQRLALFDIAPGTYDDLVEGPQTVNAVVGLSIAVNLLTPSLEDDTVTWTVSGAPTGISLTGESATGCTISGSFTQAGTYPVQITAVGGTVPISRTVTFIVAPATATAPASSLYIPWLHSDLSLTDLQFDLRGRGVASYYATAGAGGSGSAINLMESDTCKLAILLFDLENPGTQIADATTIWFTARTDVDTQPIIDTNVTGSAALITVSGGTYYLLALNLSADPVLDAINDLDDPGAGAPAVLTLHCQLAVLRSSNSQVARSAPFVITITERVTDAGLPPLNQY